MTTTAVIVALAVAATAAVGCVCNAHCSNEFAAACAERGGHVRSVAPASQQCVAADGGVVATWVDDDGGGIP